MTKVHQDLRVSSQTSRSTGFQENNIMTGGQDSETEAQALEAISNLAIANAEDKQTIATLIATNASLVAELTQLRSEFTAFRKTSRNVLKHYFWTCRTHCDRDSKI